MLWGTRINATERISVELENDQVEEDVWNNDDTSEALRSSAIHGMEVAFKTVSNTDILPDEERKSRNEGENNLLTVDLIKIRDFLINLKLDLQCRSAAYW